MKYEPTKASLRKHEVPEWFHNAKFGIFIHWGLYSVPAFAVKKLSFSESQNIEEAYYFKNNPYAEWYLNTLRISGSLTQEYHNKEYGEDFSYDKFVPIFNEELKKWKPQEWAELFKCAGAKYVVLVTKHHDGFLLWPSKYPNPFKENYSASRNIISELTNSVKDKGMKMGFYYSTSFDWSFNPEPIDDRTSDMTNGITTPEYTEYVKHHWNELIDDYEPSILWSDIGAPPLLDIFELFAEYYNRFPDGVINDRWDKIFHKDGKVLKMRRTFFYDFTTPEYESYNIIKKKKWESNRGIGNSYGYNKTEKEGDYLSSTELIRMLVDIVSKNGNLLLNVGPMPDGTIPEVQKHVLQGIGRWLEINGEGIYGTHPWERADGKTIDNSKIRFTQTKEIIYIHLLNNPKGKSVRILSLKIPQLSTITLLGYNDQLLWEQDQEDLIINIPENLIESPVYVFKV
ncbi:MAG: alpha-L-fucosidase, partial [Candidatus Lokiarchaeota archaeon]|nr:alpha-L-fucosidase [Candidatus Lokiarchaeota archaeon]